jgi:hypothetical protein
MRHLRAAVPYPATSGTRRSSSILLDRVPPAVPATTRSGAGAGDRGRLASAREYDVPGMRRRIRGKPSTALLLPPLQGAGESAPDSPRVSAMRNVFLRTDPAALLLASLRSPGGPIPTRPSPRRPDSQRTRTRGRSMTALFIAMRPAPVCAAAQLPRVHRVLAPPSVWGASRTSDRARPRRRRR